MTTRLFFLKLWVFFAVGGVLSGQASNDNAWLNPGSGNWEDAANWTAGLPNSNQFVLITNAGWKAVGLGANAANNFPGSLAVGTLTITSPVDTLNVFLLNYAGYATPFRANEIIVNSNALMTILGSAVQVTNVGQGDYRIEIGGAVNQGGFSSVNTTFLSLGNVGPGVYNLTNGTVYGATEYLGGGAYSATFNQFGGYHTANLMRLLSGGQYNLFGGSLGGTIEFGGYRDTVQQDGGYCDAFLQSLGNYTLNGGVYTNNSLFAPYDHYSNGQFTQNGGSNLLGHLSFGQTGGITDGSGASYTLNNGWLSDFGTSIMGYGSLTQTGGMHLVSGEFLTDGGVYGGRGGTYFPVEGAVNLSGGISICDRMRMAFGYFSQTGGTNQVKQSLTCSNFNYLYAGSGYFLSGGLLQCSNVVLMNTFHQSGGSHQVASGLSLSGLTTGYQPQPVRYYLSGTGALSAAQIQVSNQAEFVHTGGIVQNNPFITLAGGSWLASTGTTQLGPLNLGTAGVFSNSIIKLDVNSAMLFANSAAQPWPANARLTILNWRGSINGNGNNRVSFGPGGLTQSQVALAQFQDPIGVGGGLYPARLLSNGELVPDRALISHMDNKALILEWPSGSTLQSATNVTGPYVDMSGAHSPYTNNLIAPRLFFRLRM
jgi:hypothetical protein